MKKFECANCFKIAYRDTSSYNLAMRIDAPLYCSRACAGEARRHNKSESELKEDKRIYDIEYGRLNKKKIKAKKKAYFKKDYAENPEKYRAIRKKKYPEHLKYLQTPEYRKYKKEYDKKNLDRMNLNRRKRNYGEFAEASQVLTDIEKELRNG